MAPHRAPAGGLGFGVLGYLGLGFMIWGVGFGVWGSIPPAGCCSTARSEGEAARGVQPV